MQIAGSLRSAGFETRKSSLHIEKLWYAWHRLELNGGFVHVVGCFVPRRNRPGYSCFHSSQNMHPSHILTPKMARVSCMNQSAYFYSSHRYAVAVVRRRQGEQIRCVGFHALGSRYYIRSPTALNGTIRGEHSVDPSPGLFFAVWAWRGKFHDSLFIRGDQISRPGIPKIRGASVFARTC
jgi:hypothetical protein